MSRQLSHPPSLLPLQRRREGGGEDAGGCREEGGQVGLPVVDQVKETHTAGEREALRDEVKKKEVKKGGGGRNFGRLFVCLFVCFYGRWPGGDHIFVRGKQL